MVPQQGGGIYSSIRKRKKDREPDFVKLLKLEVTPGMTIFEIGTNVGYYTFIMARLLHNEGVIHAIEPHPNSYKYLVKNISINNYQKLIIPHNFAIGDTDDMADFYIDSSIPNLSSSIYRKSCKKINIRYYTLDSFISEFGYPNFIKMDIEGFEVEVLSKIDSLQKSFPLKILFETHPAAYNNKRDMKKLLYRLIDFGFNIKYVVSAGHIIPKIFKDKGYTPNKELQIKSLNRGIYTNVNTNDAINFCSEVNSEWCQNKNKYSHRSVRYIMLERK
jgi:FkbM family methyltransferase